MSHRNKGTTPGGEWLHLQLIRIESLQRTREALDADIAEIRADIERRGFDLPVVDRMLEDRRLTPAALEQRLIKEDLYRRALRLPGPGQAAAPSTKEPA